MSSNHDQTREVHDTPLPASSLDNSDDLLTQETIQWHHQRIKKASGKWPSEWLSQNYRPRPEDWDCVDVAAMADLVEHARNCYRNVFMTHLSIFFQRTGTFDDKTETWTSSDVVLHCEEAKAFITFMENRMINTTPYFGGERVFHPSGSQDSDSSNEAKTSSRKRKRHQNTPPTPNHESSRDGISPKSSIYSDSIISQTPVYHPLPPMDPTLEEIEGRIQDNLRDIDTHHWLRIRVFKKIRFNNLEGQQERVKLAQEKRDAAFKRKEKFLVQLSSRKEQESYFGQDGDGTLDPLEEKSKIAEMECWLSAGTAEVEEEQLQIIEKRVRDLRAAVEKIEKHMLLCREKIDNEGYPEKVVVLRQDLYRLCAANLVELSPNEIYKIQQVIQKFLSVEEKKDWA